MSSKDSVIDWEKEFNEFWKPLLQTNDKWDEEKIKNELHDLAFILKQVPKVYDHVAGLSKPMYDAQAIITAHDDRCHEYCVNKDDHEDELTQARLDAKREVIEEAKRNKLSINLTGIPVDYVKMKDLENICSLSQKDEGLRKEYCDMCKGPHKSGGIDKKHFIKLAEEIQESEKA